MIDGRTSIYGIMANPVEHSYSPMMQNYFAERTGTHSSYIPLKVERGMVKEGMEGAYALHINGLNVTVPYKQEVIPYLKEIDPGAEAIGAVNTLVRIEGGYKGYNTDAPGLYRAMAEKGITVEGESCILLGAGGAAKAAACTLGEHGAKKVYVLNRNRDRAVELAIEAGERFQGTDFLPMALTDHRQIPEGNYLCIQSTSVGMAPDTEAVLIEDPEFYRKIHTGFDLIYTPWETSFMKRVSLAGGKAYNGLDMLIYQGVIAFELWNPSVTVGADIIDGIRKKMKKKLLPGTGNMIFTGFMGAGKTSVGKAYAHMHGMNFLDTDSLIESRAGKTIREIFRDDGEEQFRRMETELVRELAGQVRNTVISVGGGLPLRAENRAALREAGTVVYLRIRPETVCSRLKDDHTRPLLQGENPEEKVKTLLAERETYYQEAAHILVETDDRTVEEIVRAVEEREVEQ